jgi:phage-related minor tail protein
VDTRIEVGGEARGIVIGSGANGATAFNATDGGVDGALHDPAVTDGTVFAGTATTLYSWRIPA